MVVHVNVPESWLKRITASEFVAKMNAWLELNAPCDICDGFGTVNTGDGIHMGPDDDDRPCPECKYDAWESPI